VAKVAEAQPGLLLLQGGVWDDLEALKEQLTVGRAGGGGGGKWQAGDAAWSGRGKEGES
jgi:hypothetical protein